MGKVRFSNGKHRSGRVKGFEDGSGWDEHLDRSLDLDMLGFSSGILADKVDASETGWLGDDSKEKVCTLNPNKHTRFRPRKARM